MNKVINDLNGLLEVLTPKVLVDIIEDKMGGWNANANSWLELGFDDLDEVEIIMEIEKECECHISDEFADRMYREISPKALYKSLMRHQNLTSLGI